MSKNDNLDKDLLRRAIRSVESAIDDTYTEVYHFHKPSLHTVLKAANLWLMTLEYQEPNTQSQDYLMKNDNVLVLPPGPRCNRCGHVVCPGCVNWCDEIKEDGNLCCDGSCDISTEASRKWHEQIDPMLDAATDAGMTVIVAEGPCQWE